MTEGNEKPSPPSDGALAQFVNAKIVGLGLNEGEVFWLEIELGDGTVRTVSVYHPFHEDIAVRIDGMFVPAEEL